ncbi:hypothetical protein LEN26_019696, partial [Aphanomyces euteiches]
RLRPQEEPLLLETGSVERKLGWKDAIRANGDKKAVTSVETNVEICQSSLWHRVFASSLTNRLWIETMKTMMAALFALLALALAQAGESSPPAETQLELVDVNPVVVQEVIALPLDSETEVRVAGGARAGGAVRVAGGRKGRGGVRVGGRGGVKIGGDLNIGGRGGGRGGVKIGGGVRVGGNVNIGGGRRGRGGIKVGGKIGGRIGGGVRLGGGIRAGGGARVGGSVRVGGVRVGGGIKVGGGVRVGRGGIGIRVGGVKAGGSVRVGRGRIGVAVRAGESDDIGQSATGESNEDH